MTVQHAVEISIHVYHFARGHGKGEQYVKSVMVNHIC